jgi:NH3-dependent NAD+ synthetase
VAAHGYQGVALGVSGGIDSAVAGALAVGSLGPERVYGLILPERDSAPRTVKDARLVCAFLGIDHRIIRITSLQDEPRELVERTEALLEHARSRRVRSVQMESG